MHTHKLTALRNDIEEGIASGSAGELNFDKLEAKAKAQLKK